MICEHYSASNTLPTFILSSSLCLCRPPSTQPRVPLSSPHPNYQRYPLSLHCGAGACGRSRGGAVRRRNIQREKQGGAPSPHLLLSLLAAAGGAPQRRPLRKRWHPLPPRCGGGRAPRHGGGAGTATGLQSGSGGPRSAALVPRYGGGSLGGAWAGLPPRHELELRRTQHACKGTARRIDIDPPPQP
jgi:hypothetical protein